MGSRYAWTILVGTGSRSFYAYARDAAGNGAATTVVSIEATSTPGIYQARTTVTTTAQPGWRGVEIQAADDKGRRTIAPRRHVYVQ